MPPRSCPVLGIYNCWRNGAAELDRKAMLEVDLMHQIYPYAFTSNITKKDNL